MDETPITVEPITAASIAAEPVKKTLGRWFRLSPDRFVVGQLLLLCLLWLSERFQWFAFDHRKGWMVLIALAGVAVTAVAMLLWWVGALIFARRFQFRIRTLLAFCLATSIAVGWFRAERDRAKWQKETVEGVSSLGGAVVYDWQVGTPRGSATNAEPPGPERLRKVLGDDFFAGVVAIESDHEIADARLEHFGAMNRLVSLILRSNKVTDAGLEYLKGLTQLNRLYLDGTAITDAGLEHLEVLVNLHALSLNRTKITDAGVEHLERLTQLQDLWLYDTGVTTAGANRLQQVLHNCKIYH